MNFTALLKKTGQIALAIALLSGVPIHAQSILTLPVQSFNSGPGITTYSFATFDSSLGTLTSVEIDLNDVVVTGSATATNNTSTVFPPGSAENIFLNYSNTYKVSDSAGNKVTVTITTPVDEFDNVPATGAGSTFTDTGMTGSESPSVTSTILTGASVNPYINNPSNGASITLTLAASNRLQSSADAGTNSASVSAFGSATASGNIDVIYTYTPVPEPIHAAGLMIGFALCVLVGRNYLRRNTAAVAV